MTAKIYMVNPVTNEIECYVPSSGEEQITPNGIKDIQKIESIGKKDIYHMIFQDDTFFEYEIVNGADGDNGFSPVVTVSNVAEGKKIIITDADGTKEIIVRDGKSLTFEDLNEQQKLALKGDRGAPGCIISDTEPTDPDVFFYISMDGDESDYLNLTQLESAYQTIVNNYNAAKQELTDLSNSVLLKPEVDGEVDQFIARDANGKCVWKTVKAHDGSVPLSDISFEQILNENGDYEIYANVPVNAGYTVIGEQKPDGLEIYLEEV